MSVCICAWMYFLCVYGCVYVDLYIYECIVMIMYFCMSESIYLCVYLPSLHVSMKCNVLSCAVM